MEITLIDEFSDMIRGFVYGDATVDEIPEDDLNEIARISQNMVQRAFKSADKLFNDHSFVCADCGRRVAGEGYALDQGELCPGCLNYHMLRQEIMKESLRREDGLVA